MKARSVVRCPLGVVMDRAMAGGRRKECGWRWAWGLVASESAFGRAGRARCPTIDLIWGGFRQAGDDWLAMRDW